MAYTPTRLYQGQLSNTETTSTPGILNAAVPASTTWIVKEIVLCNTSAVSSQTIYLSIVPSGGTGGSANRIIGGYVLAAGQTTTFDLSIVMTNGDFITGYSTTASIVTATISGVVIT